MSLIQGTSMASAAGGYDVTNAIHFSAASSQYFLKTYGAAATDTKKFTFSTWIKKAKVNSATSYGLFSGGTGTSAGRCDFQFTAGAATGDTYYDQLKFEIYNGSWTFRVATPMLRDPSSFYHVVLIYDVANATAADTLIMYVNNVRQTLNSATAMPNNASLFMSNGAVSCIGADTSATRLGFDGVMSEIMAVDGQALDPTYFGEFDDNGVWRPIDVSGLTFGTNGFYITSADGVDQSGNSNNFTPTNSPTDTSDTPSTIYPTLNPIYKGASFTTSNGNLTGAGNSSTRFCGSTMAASAGKYMFGWQYISTPDALMWNGLVSDAFDGDLVNNVGGDANGWAVLYELSSPANTVRALNNGTYINGGTTIVVATGDTMLVAWDATNKKAWMGIYDTSAGLTYWLDSSGTMRTTDEPGLGTNETFTLTGNSWMPAFSANTSQSFNVFFGAAGLPSGVALPTGFQFINSANIYANDPPAIEDGSAHFQTALHTGTGSAITVTQTGNSTFTSDFVWTKGRSGATDHILSNIISGTGKYLVSNTTAAEVTNAQALTAFGAGSISYGTLAAASTNAATYVDWMWKGGGAGVSNASGSITSTVSANTTAGISIVGYTGTGANATVGHGLGSVPSMIIVRGLTGTKDWYVWHTSFGNGTSTLYMNATNAVDTGSSTWWNSTTPSSTVFSLGTSASTNGSAVSHVAICFAPIASFSAMGQYTGNGSANGPFIYTGFTPTFLLVKNTTQASNWMLVDIARNPYNPTINDLAPNLSDAEPAVTGSASFDLNSNGFKLRGTNLPINANGNTFIYAAFAEVPSFGATPAKAR